jgi:RHS repeat-associated protein
MTIRNNPYYSLFLRKNLSALDEINVRRAELDEYYYGARYYNPRESVWLSVDPLFEKTMTPYQYTYQNPLKYTDPTGMSSNPIYDENGNFLGTDDRGLQGEAIIMNKNDFSQSMSHNEAKSKGTLLSNYNVELDGKGGLTEKGKYQAAVFDRVNLHSLGLKNRPDYDGFLTLSEANEWYRNGNGQPLFVNASKIDLSPLYNGDLKEGEERYVNFASPKYANFQMGLVYGTIKLKMLTGNNVQVGKNDHHLDTYDFDYQEGRLGRNIVTWIGEKVAGTGRGYKIYSYGIGKLGNRPIFKPVIFNK